MTQRNVVHLIDVDGGEDTLPIELGLPFHPQVGETFILSGWGNYEREVEICAVGYEIGLEGLEGETRESEYSSFRVDTRVIGANYKGPLIVGFRETAFKGAGDAR